MARKQLPTDIPKINIPFAVAKARYGKEVADLMAKKAQSVAEAAKRMTADEFRWTLEYIQAPDPDSADPERFVDELASKSEIYLVARGGNWKGWEQLAAVPPQIMARFEERAKLVCNVVQHEPEQHAPSNGIVESLDEWLASHPHADRRLAAVARLALASLVETGE